MALSLRSCGRAGVGALRWLVGRYVAGAGLSLDFRRPPCFPPSTRDGGRLVDDRRHSSPDRCRPPTGWLAGCAVVALVWGSSCCAGTFAASLAVLADAAVVGLVLPFPSTLHSCPMLGRLGVATDGDAAATALPRTAESARWRWSAFAARSASLAVLVATRITIARLRRWSSGGRPLVPAVRLARR